MSMNALLDFTDLPRFDLFKPEHVTPAIATLLIIKFMWSWNEFFWPYLVGRDESLQVLPVALQTFKTQTPQGQPDWTGLMAAATVALRWIVKDLEKRFTKDPLEEFKSGHWP